MGFRHWLLENRLRSTERKLRRLRSTLKRLRTKAEKEGADKAKLEARRHDVTREIDELSHREKALKEELRAA